MNANATIPMTSNAPACRGFKGLRCPLCGTADDVQSLGLDDLQTLRCAGCDESYSVADVRALVAAWQRLLHWIDAAPAVED